METNPNWGDSFYDDESTQQTFESFGNENYTTEDCSISSGPPEILPEEVEIYQDRLKGTGSFGSVFEGRCRGQSVAVKVLHDQSIDEENLKTFRREMQIMSTIAHPNVILYMGGCSSRGKLQIITELMDTNLLTVLEEKLQLISLQQKMEIALDCARGINWLHCSNPQIIHHDIKPSNFLVDSSNRVKGCDFGLSMFSKKGHFISSEGPRGSAAYMAPEVYEGQPYDEKCDVYSFGVLLLQIYTGEEPAAEIRKMMSVDSFLEAVCQDNLRPHIPEDCPVFIKNLIEDCWDADPLMRPSFQSIVSRLEYALVEVCIADPEAKSFWLTFFPHKSRVSFGEFMKGFAPLMKLDDREDAIVLYKCLEKLLVIHREVTTAQFGRILDYFGPLNLKLEGEFFYSVKSVLEKGWFHGDLSTADANSLLRRGNTGEFLVRFSSSERGYFTISVKKEGKNVHQRIRHQPLSPVYEVGDAKYSSLNELILSEKEKLQLSTPSIGSPFVEFFCGSTDQSDSGYIQ